MTNEEAIKGLKNLFSIYELDLPYTDSLEIEEMAIEALQHYEQTIDEFTNKLHSALSNRGSADIHDIVNDVAYMFKERIYER